MKRFITALLSVVMSITCLSVSVIAESEEDTIIMDNLDEESLDDEKEEMLPEEDPEEKSEENLNEEQLKKSDTAEEPDPEEFSDLDFGTDGNSPEKEEETVVSYSVNPFYENLYTSEDIARILPVFETEEGSEALDESAAFLYTSPEEAALCVRTAILMHQESISIPFQFQEDERENLSSSVIVTMALNGMDDYGRASLYGSGLNASYTFTGNGHIKGLLTFSLLYFTTADQEKEFEARVRETVDSMGIYYVSEFEKVKAIYQFIASHVTYDYEHLNDNNYILKHSAYAALVNGTSVCQGYAALFCRMASLVGLNAHYLTGIANGGEHAWNSVSLNGKYYLVDVTWDSNYKDDHSRYQWFLRGTGNFSDHTCEHGYGPDYSTEDYAAGSEKEVSPSSITLKPETDTLFNGETILFRAEVFPAEASNKIVNFSSDNEAIATVDSLGRVTGHSTGTTKIHASTINGLTADSEVKVIERDYIPVDNYIFENFDYTKDAFIIPYPDRAGKRIPYTVTPANATDKSLIWVSMEPEIVKADEDGLLHGVSLGSTLVSVNAHGVTSTVIEGRYVNVQVAGVDFGTDSISLKPGQNYSFNQLKTYPEDADIYWETSNPSVASVDHNGMIHGVSEGECDITARIRYGTRIDHSIPVKVESETVHVKEISLDQTSVSVIKGKITKLNALVLPANASNKNVIWASKNKSIASVDQNGKITGISEGKTAVTVKTEDGGFTAECMVTVTKGSSSVIPDASDFEITRFAHGPGLSDITVTITKYNGNENNIEIPSEINGEPVVEIGHCVFKDCDYLTEIIIPESVEKIGSETFAGCKNLKHIKICSDAATYTYDTFAGCTGLASAGPIGSGADMEFGWKNRIPDHAFSYLENLSEVNLPDSIASIGIHAFHGCEKLKSIAFPKELTSIGFAALSGCNQITSVIIPEKVSEIPGEMFLNCTSLSSVAIPAGLQVIDSGAFYNVPIGLTVYYDGSEDDWNTIIKEDGNESLKNSNIIFQSSDSHVTDNGYTYIPNYDGTVTINGYKGNEKELVIPSAIDGKTVTGIGRRGFYGSSDITKVIIPDSVSTIGGMAFENCGNLTEVCIGKNIKSIGGGAFRECKNLVRFTVQGEMDYIGGQAFLGCSKLKTVGPLGSDSNIQMVIPEVITNEFLETCIFSNSENLDIPYGVKKIEGKITNYNSGLKSIVLPESLTDIKNEAFYYCRNLEYIQIPKSVQNFIGDFPFLGCTNLKSAGPIGSGSDYEFGWTDSIPDRAFSGSEITEIIFPKGLRKMGDSVFSGCRYLKEITIPEGVEYIGVFGFTGCNELTHVSLPDTLIRLGDCAFGDSPKLKTAGPRGSGANVEFGWKTVIPPYAFGQFDYLESVELPETISGISYNAFSNCIHLKSIEIPEGVPEIAQNQFAGCSKLSMITIHKNVKRIYSGAFDGVQDGLIINYYGSKDDWKAIQIDGNNETLKKAVINYIVPVTGIVLSNQSLVLSVNETCTLTASVHTENAINKNVIGSSDNTSVAEVDQNGRVMGKLPGSAVITVRTEDGDRKASCSITVKKNEIAVTGVTLNQTTLTMNVGSSTKLTATVSPSNADNKKIIWSSDNVNVAEVNKTGEVTANKSGTAVITATAEDGGFKAVCNVNIISDGIHMEDIDTHYEYTGSAIKPVIQISDGGRILTEKTDYSVSYKNNIQVGTATVTISGKGMYNSRKDVTFQITPADISEADAEAITLVQATKPKKLTIKPKVTWNGMMLKAKKDYTIDYNGWDQMSIGEHIVILRGVGNFAESEKKITVNVAESSKEFIPVTKLKVTAKAVNYTDGINIDQMKKTITVLEGKTRLEEGKDYEVSEDRDCDKAGTCKFVITGKGDRYYGQRTVSVKINGTPISKATVSGTVTYDGTEKTLDDPNLKLTIAVGRETKTLTKEDYKILDETYTNNVNAGKATVMIEGLGAYSGTGKMTFTINPNQKKKDSIVSIEDAVYTKGGAKPKVIVEGFRENVDYKVIYKNNAKSGTGTVIVKFQGNCKGTPEVVKNYTINPKSLEKVYATTADVVWSNKAGNYISKITLTDTDGKKLVAGTDYEKTIQYLDNDGIPIVDLKASYPAGTKFTAVITAKGNYTGTKRVEYRLIDKTEDISKATFRIDPKEFTGAAIELEDNDFIQASFKDKPKLKLNEDFEIVCYENNIRKGTAKATLHGREENGYGGYKTITFKIVQRSMSEHWIDTVMNAARALGF